MSTINQLLADVYSDKKDRAIMDDFLEFAKNGQLDFYDIEVWKIPTRYIDALIYHGLFLDEMAESNHKRLHKALIEQDAKSEYYEKWNDPYDDSIRTTFARKGYFIEQYLNDTSKYVRMTALKHSPEYFLNSNIPSVATYALKTHPEYLPELIESTKDNHIFAVHEILIDKHDVTEDELLTHIYILNNQLGNDPQDYGGFSEIDLRAEMRMKIAAEKATLNNFEKTMSREQLYDAKNIAWAKGLTVREIEQWRLEYDKKHPYIDMDTLREQEGWLDVYYEYDE